MIMMWCRCSFICKTREILGKGKELKMSIAIGRVLKINQIKYLRLPKSERKKSLPNEKTPSTGPEIAPFSFIQF